VEIIDDRRAGKVVVNLIGRLNKCGVISPRFDVGLKDIETWTNNLLPSRQFGRLVLTTSAGTSPPPHSMRQFNSSTLSLPPPLLTPIAPGIMDHNEARRKSTGGKILGFFY
jgi:small subunit ribosomal protein S15Ae